MGHFAAQRLSPALLDPDRWPIFMTRTSAINRSCCLAVLALLGPGIEVRLTAQSIPGSPEDLWREPVLARDQGWSGAASLAQRPPSSRFARFRLFRMPSAFPSDPVGLDTDPDPPPDEAGSSMSAADFDPALDSRVQLTVGSDNPFFDFRRPGDPGGVGYYRLHSQVQLVDGECAGLCMGLQAVTPAGLEGDGLSEGPTILIPNLAWYCAGSGGTAIHGFVGKNLRANSRWSEGFDRGVEYGLALQSPLPGLETSSRRCLHLFLEALGRYRFDADPTLRSTSAWDLLPGLHWQLRDNWWLSGGVLMPLGSPRSELQTWQITCSWQF